MNNKIVDFYKIATSKVQINSLGYPEVFSKLFIKRFGKNAHILARWMNDYYSWNRDKSPKEWIGDIGSLSGDNMSTLLGRLESAQIGEDEYDRWAKENGYSTLSEMRYNSADGTLTELGLDDIKEYLLKEIEKQFNNSAFFNRDLIRDIVSGEITDLNQYKKMDYDTARDKYMRKKVFSETDSLLDFEDGYRWLDVGNNCDYVGDYMKNCGSTGVMGTDEDRTMIVLVDKNNKPHVAATYHPNHKRISGIEGAGSSTAKEKYHKYILSIINKLNVDLEERNSSKLHPKLEIKYLFRDFDLKIEDFPTNNDMREHFKLKINDEIWLTNKYKYLSEEDAAIVHKFIINDKKTLDKIKNFSSIKDPKNSSFEKLISYIVPGDTREIKRIESLTGASYISKYKIREHLKSKDRGPVDKLSLLKIWLKKRGFIDSSNKVLLLSMASRKNPIFNPGIYREHSDYDDFYPDLDKEQIDYEHSYDNLYCGKRVCWIGNAGRMVKVDSNYIYPIHGNQFYQDKLSFLENKIRENELTYLYAPYGTMSKIEISDIQESIIYNGQDYDHSPLTTGDSDLDNYLANKEDYDEEESAEMEEALSEAIANNEGDLGNIIFNVRDGNHRAFAARAAGEPYIWVMLSDNQTQDILEDDGRLSHYKEYLR